MNREENFVITINRQFGTGGHKIGVILAERLGVKLLDKQVLKSLAEEKNAGFRFVRQAIQHHYVYVD